MVAAPAFPKRFEVYLATLDPTRGAEIKKTRPAVIVSPDELNAYLRTVLVAPLTSAERAYPTRVPVRFASRNGHIAIDQMRAVDRGRLIKRLGKLDAATATSLLERLQAMFVA